MVTVSSASTVAMGELGSLGMISHSSLQSGGAKLNKLMKPGEGRRVKVYVIDPVKLQERLEKMVDGLSGKNGIQPISPPIQPIPKVTKPSVIPKQPLDSGVGDDKKEIHRKVEKKKNRSRKRKIAQDVKDDVQEAAELTFLMKEATTRVGRKSKSVVANASAAAASLSITPPTPTPVVKVRKREPPDMFRCQVCQKVYVGHTKLNSHFRKFPDHRVRVNGSLTKPLVNLLPRIQTAKLPEEPKSQNHNPIQNQTVKILVQIPPTVQTEPIKECNIEMHPIIGSKSYPVDPVLIPTFQPPSLLQPISVPDLCLREHMNLHIDNDAESNCFDNYTLSHQHQDLLSIVLNGDNQIRIANSMVSPENIIIGETHPMMEQEPVLINDNNNVFLQFHEPESMSMHTESSMDGVHVPSNQQAKSIWQYVKRQIKTHGIHQACGEITEMAEKLSKVARDKFIPVREEEVEQLGNSAPIVQVDTPFFSHLLDLPFGTYVFKEDAGIRTVLPPPPPASAELSLTGGVEVDIDKFLSPDIDLINLPHLTNLDFSAICNN